MSRAPAPEASAAAVEYEDVEVDTDAPLRLCKHQLEHEGGAFWCNFPIGHAGPHEPAPHEIEGYSIKRQRAPPKRLSDDPDPRGEMKRAKKPREDEQAANASDEAHHEDDENVSRRSAGHAPRSPAVHKRADQGSVMRVLEPSGHITVEQEERRKSFAGEQLGELQAKLPEEMRSAGWQVIPKGSNAMETGHFYVRLPPPTSIHLLLRGPSAVGSMHFAVFALFSCAFASC